MPDRIIMPKTGMAMEEGTLVRWLKQPGETVSRGEAIAVIETDKVTMELESEYDGTLLEIVHRDGDVVPVTHTIAWVGAPGENIPADADGAAASPAAASTPAPASPAEHAPGTTFRDGKIPATPAARAAAAAAGIPLASVAGSGPCGAVRLKDLAPAPTIVPAAGSQPAPETSIPVSGMRRAIAEKMLRSHQQVPSVTLVTRADVTELAALRSKMNAGGGQKVSWTDFILRAAAAALRQHPLLNSVIEGDRILVKREIDIGIAVALETGLVVPVIRGADTLTVRQVAAAARDLAERARSGSLVPQECTGRARSRSPTSACTGSRSSRRSSTFRRAPSWAWARSRKPFERGRAGGIEARKVMSLCLTHDHRHIDGAPAAAFLGSIKALLEDCWSLIV